MPSKQPIGTYQGFSLVFTSFARKLWQGDQEVVCVILHRLQEGRQTNVMHQHLKGTNKHLDSISERMTSFLIKLAGLLLHGTQTFCKALEKFSF